MANVSIRFECGCGFSTKSPKDAAKHSDEKKHTLTVTGQVKK